MLTQLNIPLPLARSLKSPCAVAAHTNKNKLSPSHPCKGAIFPKLGARAVVINPAQPSLPSYPHPARCSARGWRVGCCSCTALSGLLKYLMVPKYDLIDDIIFISYSEQGHSQTVSASYSSNVLSRTLPTTCFPAHIYPK